MSECQENFSSLLRVFVYGTLKPDEANYQKYCDGKVVNTIKCYTFGQLFALPQGYPAMTLGNSPVYGYLLEFYSSEVLAALDELEDYYPDQPASENLYNRQQVQIYDLQGRSLGWAWIYIMTLDMINQLGGRPQADGWWSGN